MFKTLSITEKLLFIAYLSSCLLFAPFLINGVAEQTQILKHNIQHYQNIELQQDPNVIEI